jgi:hypothetical protein
MYVCVRTLQLKPRNRIGEEKSQAIVCKFYLQDGGGVVIFGIRLKWKRFFCNTVRINVGRKSNRVYFYTRERYGKRIKSSEFTNQFGIEKTKKIDLSKI